RGLDLPDGPWSLGGGLRRPHSVADAELNLPPHPKRHGSWVKPDIACGRFADGTCPMVISAHSGPSFPLRNRGLPRVERARQCSPCRAGSSPAQPMGTGTIALVPRHWIDE